MVGESQQFLVVFAKLSIDQATKTITLRDDTLYFGGIATSKEEAADIARAVVTGTDSKHRAFTLPRIFTLDSNDLISTMMDAQERFEALVESMNEQTWLLDQS